MRISFVSKSFASESGAIRKGRLLTGVAGVAGLLGLFPGAVSAQDAAAPAEAEEAAPIVVTGSRIVRDGNDAPTPVSVISAQEIANEAPANIADFVNTLPSVSGSQTAVSNSGSLSNGASGVSALNLRSLGQNRTLILIDGKRSVSSTSTGLVDVNTIPQALIERVEVVTGGASSAYGSDAVAGVVNFVLDKDFTGIKADYEYGITTYGDIPNHKMSLTAGTSFAGGRGHVILSGEYFTQEGVHSIDRAWNNNGVFQINNPNYTATNGQPERLILSGVGSSNFTPGGLITGCRNAAGAVSGCSLTNTYFGNIGANGQASVNQLARGLVSGQWMVGGDYQVTSANHAGSNSLANDEDRISVFGRASFEVADWLTVFGQASYNKFKGYSIYQQTPSVGVSIAVDNAFLPTQVRDQMIAQGLTSITMGTSNAGITGSGADTGREVQRYVVGGEGRFSLFGRDIDWDVYYQHGKTKTRETLTDTWFNPRMAAMQDAVFDGEGNIVCRVNIDANLTNDLPGCVPINRIGVGGVTQEAKDFLFAIYPEREQYIGQDVAGFNFSTPRLFEGWAGPIALAFGAEYREESVDGYTDENQYSTTATWLYGNFRVTKGSYNVKEAYAETIVPLYDGVEFNGAFRVTDYSISGTVSTWKAGLTWQPIDDIRFRGTVSRDIRAPNLSELFDPGTARTNSVNVPDGSGGLRAEEFIQNFTGNLNLKPEVAKTYGAGIVFTPTFLDGFAAAIDYFDIKVTDSIDSVSSQNTANLCFEQNVQAFCDNIIYAAGSTTDITFINQTYMNFASQHVKGYDFEASYRMALGAGKLSLRGLATYYLQNITDTGFEAPNDSAGTRSLPKLTYRAQIGYAFDSGFELNMIGRGFSDMVIDNDFIECTTACPATDPINRTINENDVKGSLYFDFNANYSFEVGPSKARAFIAIRNLFDRDPVLTGNGPDGNNTPAYPQTARSQFDTFGRVFRLGVSLQY
ncbi:TonB-dependent receptor [Altererythrobacter xixiisoli]|uniref:TonB-dependent receptor n=1 Tax=Croceibacterium xixiisoli TaxID=1476466 RepID=A0A6I4TX75_9SPHN|nr:TonB-dependent receptor [Croceibacterium xixiisoli]